jgi:hypothetical protein
MSLNRRKIFELNESFYATAPNYEDRPKVMIDQGGETIAALDTLNIMIHIIAKL